MSQPPEPVIVARGLTKRFGELVAVNELSITVNRGDIYGFLGPNGSGKTTTIRMLLRLIRRNAGQIEILGKNLDEAPLEILGQVGALVEEPAFYPYLSGRQNLQAFGRLVGRVPKGRVDEVIELVGLKGRGNDKVTVYSQGMRQRLGIGQALLMRPKLLFLDEPTNGLDPPGIESMRLILRRLTEEEGVTILVSSHLLHEIEVLCNRVAILKRGAVLVEGCVRELLETGQVRVEIGVDDVGGAIAAIEGLGLEAERSNAAPDRLVLRVSRDRVPEINRALVEANVSVRALIPRRPTLEEYFRDRIDAAPRELAEATS